LDGRPFAGRETEPCVNNPAFDLATLPASPQQRRAALVAIASLAAIALVAAPVARVVVGTFPGFVTLYGGAVLMGLAITVTILFGQYALSPKPSLLALACGVLFSAILFIPYILTFPGAGAVVVGRTGSFSTYLWIVWHTALPAAFAAYALLGPRDGTRRLSSGQTTAAVVATLVAAYAAIQFTFAFADALPPLARAGQYLIGIYLALGAVAVLSAGSLVMLQRRAQRTVLDGWLMVPTAALLIESLLNALGGSRYSVGWYLSRVDILIATTFLVVALLAETNRLSRVLAANESRLRGIVDGVADALIAVDERAIIASVNPAAAALFGFVAEHLVGTAVARILPNYATLANPAEPSTGETVGRDARGNLFPVEVARGRDLTHAFGETIVILRDITQRKTAQDAIHAAHDRAIEAAEVKSQFLATMSHEIRTPINAVVGMSELLLQTPLSDEGREYTATVRDSAASLLSIVNDILDFSKIEAGRMELERVAFVPLLAVENATDILAAAAHKKRLSLSTDIAPDVPRRVLGDADRLRQVLLNLIGNAVKFTAQGSVTVRAAVDRVEADTAVVLRFSVSDTGPGIAPEVAERLFEPFRQADQSTRRRFGGTGLGLSISRRIVELMGGTIGFESDVGRGSTFWFAVPFPTAAASTESEPQPEATHGALEAVEEPHGEGVLVLVAEDNPVNRTLALQQLKKLGYRAHAVTDGREAIDALAHRSYDLILMDCQMPELDGFEATREIRRSEASRGGHVPIVAMTANALDGDREACLAAGMDHYLAKPVELAALRDVVERFGNGVGVAG
jgi:PAS domain S-box-containing protein